VRATAHQLRSTAFVHSVDMGAHRMIVDEPSEHGGEDEGPSPQELLAASLASCTAITLEMYARRKGWELGPVEVEVDYSMSERGGPTRFSVELHLPATVTPEQRERLQVIAAKCPVHRILEGDVIFEDRVKLISHAAG
jgi:putative redox protein